MGISLFESIIFTNIIKIFSYWDKKIFFIENALLYYDYFDIIYQVSEIFYIRFDY